MTSPTFTGETGSRKVEEIAHRHPVARHAGPPRVGGQGRGVHRASACSPSRSPSTGSGGDQPSGQGEASQTGAVAKIAETSFGSLALWVIAIGLALYVVWRLISIVLPAENTAKAG